MSDVKDVTGLGAPIEKLIDVISRGIGALFSPYIIRKNATAEGDRIKVLAAAVRTASEDAAVILNDGKLTLTAYPRPRVIDAKSSDPVTELMERADRRLDYQKARKQLNLEAITIKAAAQMRSEADVSPEPVNDDWIIRFFAAAENVSSDQMQILWAKILAGEVTRPNSVSLRTLDVLKNLTESEARIFEKVGNFAIRAGEAFIFALPEGFDAAKPFPYCGFDRSQILQLADAGLMIAAAFRLQVGRIDAKARTLFDFGTKVIVWGHAQQVLVPAFVFTSAGTQLLNLITVNPPSNYIEDFARIYLSHLESEPKCYAVTGRKGDELQFDERQQFPLPTRKAAP